MRSRNSRFQSVANRARAVTAIARDAGSFLMAGAGYPRLRLERGDDAVGLCDPSLRREPARRLGHPPPHEECVHRRDGPEGERPAPAILGSGYDQEPDESGCRPPECPERLQYDDQATADPGGGELAHVGRCHWKLGAEPEPDEESENQKRRKPAHERAGSGGEAVHEQRQGEHLPSSVAVRKEATERRTDGHADEADGGDPASLALGQPPLLREGREDEGDQTHVHRVQRPAETGAREQSEMPTRERQDVEAVSQR